MLPGSLQAMAEKGTQIVNISPLKDDLHSGADFQWIAIKPNTDMALMLALAYHIHETGKRSEEHTSELQSLMRISYAVLCLKKKKDNKTINRHQYNIHK